MTQFTIMKSIYQEYDVARKDRSTNGIETAVEYVFIYGVILTFKSEKI